MFWYAHQTMCVRWGSSVSSTLTVSNGVRQGEFCHRFCLIYGRSDLSVNLKECPTGCIIAGGTIVNHLMYADDIVLLSPSATGLSLLLHVCSRVP